MHLLERHLDDPRATDQAVVLHFGRDKNENVLAHLEIEATVSMEDEGMCDKTRCRHRKQS